jgi:DNA-binding transcriptional ArsR family regulator
VLVDEIEELASTFKALSDPTRMRLIKLLHDSSGSLCVNASAHRLGVSQSAVSQHLRVLRQAGLVRGERVGYFVHYSLDEDALEEHKARVRDVLGEEFILLK